MGKDLSLPKLLRDSFKSIHFCQQNKVLGPVDISHRGPSDPCIVTNTDLRPRPVSQILVNSCGQHVDFRCTGGGNRLYAHYRFLKV